MKAVTANWKASTVATIKAMADAKAVMAKERSALEKKIPEFKALMTYARA